MAVICRLVQVAPGLATQLATGSGDLSQVVQSARVLRNCAASGNALLLYFVDNGDDD